jgi:hypothetical protein
MFVIKKIEKKSRPKAAGSVDAAHRTKKQTKTKAKNLIQGIGNASLANWHLTRARRKTHKIHQKNKTKSSRADRITNRSKNQPPRRLGGWQPCL